MVKDDAVDDEGLIIETSHAGVPLIAPQLECIDGKSLIGALGDGP
jgi:hypothetical protein